MGRVGRPQAGLQNLTLARYPVGFPCGQRQLFLKVEDEFVVVVIQLPYDPPAEYPVRRVAYVRIDMDHGRLLRYPIVRDKQSARSLLVFVVGVGDEYGVVHDEPAIAVDAAEVGKVEHRLFFAGRIGGVVAIVGPHGNHVVLTIFQIRCNIDDDRQVSAVVTLQQHAVEPHFRFAHDSLEVEKLPSPSPGLVGSKVLAIPHLALIVDAAAGLGRQIFHSIGERDQSPGAVVEVVAFGTFDRPFVKSPGRVHVVDLASRFGQRKEPGRREQRLVAFVTPGG